MEVNAVASQMPWVEHLISFDGLKLAFSRSSQYNARKRNPSQTFFPSGVKGLDRDLRGDGKETLGQIGASGWNSQKAGIEGNRSAKP